MTSRSRKNKGRRLVVELKSAILKRFPHLSKEDIVVMPTAVTGEDLRLSTAARMCWPFATEAKNKEKLNIWQAIAQANENSAGHLPAVVFRKNRHPIWVAVPLDTMLTLLADASLYTDKIGSSLVV